MSFRLSDWDADVPNSPSVGLLGKKRKKKSINAQLQSNEAKVPKSIADNYQATQNQSKKWKIKTVSENQGTHKKSKIKIKRKSFELNSKAKEYFIETPKFLNDHKSKHPIKPNSPQMNIGNQNQPTRSNNVAKARERKKPVNNESKFVQHNYSDVMNDNDRKSEKFLKAVKMQSKKENAQKVTNLRISSSNIHTKQNSNRIENTHTVFSENIFEENRKNSKQKSLRQRMLEKLKGARFRYINEQLYLSEGIAARSYFKDDPQSYEAYHEGYRQQVTKWPLNPLDIIIDNILKVPKDKVIADFGCGDAKLAKSVPHMVKSLDLISNDPAVTECDMAHTPLLASEIDVVVFCLSLMGTNLNEYLIEANRVLKEGGVMKIAEVESRFAKIDDFIKDVAKFGFKLLKKDLSNELFYFLDFKKEREIGKRGKKNLPEIKLRPCLYKKR